MVTIKELERFIEIAKSRGYEGAMYSVSLHVLSIGIKRKETTYTLDYNLDDGEMMEYVNVPHPTSTGVEIYATVFRGQTDEDGNFAITEGEMS